MKVILSFSGIIVVLIFGYWLCIFVKVVLVLVVLLKNFGDGENSTLNNAIRSRKDLGYS